MNAVPVADARAFASVAERTAVVRWALVVALVVLVLVAALVSRHPHLQTAQSLPVRSGDMIVLDLSASISSDTFSRIGETLRRLVQQQRPLRARRLLERRLRGAPAGHAGGGAQAARALLHPPGPDGPGEAPTFPTNPWSASFSSGTRISAGLDLAHRILLANHLGRSRVVLVSDLADDPEDVQRLNQVATTEYGRNRTPLRVVALNAAPDDAAFFARIADAAIAPAPAPAVGAPAQPAASTPAGAVPTGLLAAIAAVACLLAAHALWTARLRWRPATEPVT